MNTRLSALIVLLVCLPLSNGQEVLTSANYDKLTPSGKETDAIYGDFAIGNTVAQAVVAAPLETRNANMTVREIRGGLIDLAAIGQGGGDQLSCFYPGRRKFAFSSASVEGDSVVVTAAGSDKQLKCVVRYSMLNDKSAVQIASTWTNTTASDWTLKLEDEIRADGGKERMVKSPNGKGSLFYIDDIYWQQAYGVIAPGFKISANSNSRTSTLTYSKNDGQPVIIKPGKEFTFTRHVIVAGNLPTVRAIASEVSGDEAGVDAKVTLVDLEGKPVAGANIQFKQGALTFGTVVTDTSGTASMRTLRGKYQVQIFVDGHKVESSLNTLELGDGGDTFSMQIPLKSLSRGTVSATVVDGDGKAIPAKVEFRGSGDTPTPDWGPESAEHFVKNLAYTPSGKFEVPLRVGTYDVIVSHGPEFDAVFTKLNVAADSTVQVKVSLKRTVKTPGWISSDFHSHSSPSGDNTGSQLGRVLNLAAENVEFAPCTEHNRVSSYSGHIASQGLANEIATVSGMELTGSPLPLNHQNVFPMVHRPRTQDGGGPTTSGSPDSQIERLAKWDNGSEKLIQQNHPDIGWLYYDRDGNGEPDNGYDRAVALTDVMEIHPIDAMLKRQRFDTRGGKPFNNHRMLNWLQLLNQGYRVYGVVNTDAHYNFHGSGWLRNWIQSSTDDPARIDAEEMRIASEEGRLIMSNGPYLEALFSAASTKKPVVSGQDLVASDGKVSVDIRVQCANWLDVDTVFVLVNGRQTPELTFTRESHKEWFSSGALKFDRQIDIELKEDAHLIVVAGHRTEPLGDVCGPSGGKLPTVISNPVFVDIDGKGFVPNKDTLDFPLPVKFKKP